MYANVPDDSPLGAVDLINIVKAAANIPDFICVAGAEWDNAASDLVILKTQVYVTAPEDDDEEPAVIAQAMGVCLAIGTLINQTTARIFLQPVFQTEVFTHPPHREGQNETFEIQMQFSVHFMN